MKLFIQKHKAAITGIGACLLMGVITLSFQDTPLTVLQQQNLAVKDTVPEKEKEAGKITMKEFDALPGVIDNSIAKVAEQLKKIDWEKTSAEIRDALKKIDMDKVMADAEKAIKMVDVNKIMAEVSQALKEVKMDDLKLDISRSLKEAQESVKEVNWDEIKQELNEAKKELEKVKIDLKDINIDKAMEEARKGIEQAKTELKKYKTMFSEMEKDGLIDTKKGFKLEFRKGKMFIDGKEQSQEVTDKYKKYIDDEDFSIHIRKDKE